jgi:VWFA-related protein
LGFASRAEIALAAVIVAAAAAGAQGPPTQRDRGAGAPGGTIVSIDVIAADARGRAIETLKPAAFEVKDGGAAQALESARLITNAPRLFAIYLDEYHVAAADADRVRAALTTFIDRDLGPQDQIAIMKPLDSLFAIHASADHEAAKATIAGFAGREGDYTARNSYERNFIAGTPQRIESARTQVAWSAINALAVHLGSLGDGRKTLIVVADRLARPDRVRGESLPNIDTVVRSANKSNVAIYTVDPREASGGDAGPANALRGVPSETDGRAIDGDIASGLSRASADASSYYLLTYRTAPPEDGTFHPVDVRVARKGIQLRARKGYYAASPEDALRAALLARLNEPKVAKPPEPAPHASTLIHPWFGMSRAPDGRTRITFVWEPAGHVPGDRVRRTPSQLVLTALAADGSVLFEGPVRPTGPGVVESGVTPVRAVFDAAPGRLRLRMSIQDAAADVLDRDVRDIAVRDLHGPVAIGTPEVMRARNAREFRELDASPTVPIVAREFSRMERLLIRVPVYGRDAEHTSVSAKLVSGMGSAMRDLPVTKAADNGDAADVVEIDLPLSGLAAGEYLIDLTASSAGSQARDRLSIRVTP